MADHGFPYRSSTTFLNARRRSRDPDAPFAVAGIPYDGAVTNRPGARFGPQAIRLASLMLCDGTHPHFNVAPGNALVDAGDLRVPNTDLTAMRAEAIGQIRELLRAHHVLWLGGDHSITLAILRAHRERAGAPLGLVHLDAHCDTWTDHFGEPSGHGTWVYEAIEEGLVAPHAIVQLGIRSSGYADAREYVNRCGGRVYTARDLRGLERVADWAPIFDDVRARLGATGAPAYLSIDIDCLDPAFAPGTGTPEPGGLTTSQVLTVVEELADVAWAGMDCVEVAPPYDHAELTANAAATIVWTYLCGRIAQEQRDALHTLSHATPQTSSL